MAEKRITQRDVALRVGVGRSAVSMAFRNDPGIPPATRERIRRIAAEIGYSPDPMLTALAAYRTRLRPSNYHGTLAWLFSSRGGYDWTRFSQFRDYLEGARQAAQRHGFSIETFDLARRGAGPEKIASIFRARNITGILVCPQPAAETEITGFPWDNFSVVSFGYTLKAPRVHTVAAAQFQASIDCAQRLLAAGCRRIGFVLAGNHIKRTNLTYLGGFLAALEMAGESVRIPLLINAQPEPESLKAWLKHYKPDGIVGGYYMAGWLGKFGLRMPDDVCLASPSVRDRDGDISGVWENSPQIGVAACDLLVSLLHRGERGAPEVPQRVTVLGLPVAGKTAR
jgi:DNA-binding LacI/PurR family transcriptional regulator